MEVKRILADFRVNLTVSSEDYNKAVEAGAIFDEVNGVLFVSPRMDLLPVSKWLPFSLDGRMHSVLKVSDDYGILAWRPVHSQDYGGHCAARRQRRGVHLRGGRQWWRRGWHRAATSSFWSRWVRWGAPQAEWRGLAAAWAAVM